MEISEALINPNFWKPNLTEIAKATGKAVSTVKDHYDRKQKFLVVSVEELSESEYLKRQGEKDHE